MAWGKVIETLLLALAAIGIYLASATAIDMGIRRLRDKPKKEGR